MARKDWYTVETIKDASSVSFRVRKVDEDLKEQGAYTVKKESIRERGSPTAADRNTFWHCDCFAGLQGKDCRHKQMVREFDAANAINSGRLFNFDKRKWWEPKSNPNSLVDLDNLEM